jgi:hypothetical protein
MMRHLERWSPNDQVEVKATAAVEALDRSETFLEFSNRFRAEASIF